MARILISDKISPDAVAGLKEEHEVEEFTDWEVPELKEKIKDFDAIVIRSRTKLTKELIDSGQNLKVIARAGAGLDNVDCDYAKEKGIKVINTPTANLLSVAELTLGLALSLLRNIAKADKTTKEGLWEKKKLRGVEVSGKTWGIIGFGHIGQLVTGLLKGFSCNVLAYDPYAKEERAKELGASLVALPELMRKSDIISIHVPLLDSTRGLIGEEELSLMKGSGIIINISRGGIIDEKALYDALFSNKIAGAALDVFLEEPPKDSPLLSLDNTVLTPHIGAQTKDAQKRVGEDIVKRLMEALA